MAGVGSKDEPKGKGHDAAPARGKKGKGRSRRKVAVRPAGAREGEEADPLDVEVEASFMPLAVDIGQEERRMITQDPQSFLPASMTGAVFGPAAVTAPRVADEARFDRFVIMQRPDTELERERSSKRRRQTLVARWRGRQPPEPEKVSVVRLDHGVRAFRQLVVPFSERGGFDTRAMEGDRDLLEFMLRGYRLHAKTLESIVGQRLNPVLSKHKPHSTKLYAMLLAVTVASAGATAGLFLAFLEELLAANFVALGAAAAYCCLLLYVSRFVGRRKRAHVKAGWRALLEALQREVEKINSTIVELETGSRSSVKLRLDLMHFGQDPYEKATFPVDKVAKHSALATDKQNKKRMRKLAKQRSKLLREAHSLRRRFPVVRALVVQAEYHVPIESTDTSSQSHSVGQGPLGQAEVQAPVKLSSELTCARCRHIAEFTNFNNVSNLTKQLCASAQQDAVDYQKFRNAKLAAEFGNEDANVAVHVNVNADKPPFKACTFCEGPL